MTVLGDAVVGAMYPKGAGEELDAAKFCFTGKQGQGIGAREGIG